mgnify:CR=1 FL=1
MREKQENSIQAFTFYASYFDGAKYLSEEEQKEFLSAIPAYVFMGKEPDFKSGPLKMAWTFIVPTLDSGVANRRNGKKGGRKPKEKSAEQNPACKAPLESPVLNPALFSEQNPCPKAPQETSTQKQLELEEEQEAVVRASAPTAADSRTDSELAKIVQHYQQAVGDFPRSALDKLQRWREVYPTELICKAIDEAAENGKRSWAYTEGILKSWQADGVRTLGDVAARREARNKPKGQQEQRWEVLE